MPIRIAGIDLAWGERKPDGVCAIEATRAAARVVDIGLTRGDGELLTWLDRHAGTRAAVLAIDAPIVCPNVAGARAVDRLTHVHFGRYKCGCHPANLTKCPRPPRIARALQERGFEIGWALNGRRPRVAAEVYPHPAMVRWFDLPERIRYKRGTVVARRAEFRRLQRLLNNALDRYFPVLELGAEGRALLRRAWCKDVEDQTDGLVCALIGYWHWLHRGQRTQVLGDIEHGFLLVPAP